MFNPAKIAFNAAQSFVNTHIIPKLPNAGETETRSQTAADFASIAVNRAIETGAVKTEDEIIDCFFANLEHYKTII